VSGAAPAATARAVSSDVGVAPSPTLTQATLPRVWEGVGYRPLPDPAAARPLFDFAALGWPPTRPALAWGAFVAGERLVGALVAERHERWVLVHGPVVLEGEDRVEIAGQLVAAAIDHAAALGADTLYARPQGLDRVWVRFGFIPVPEITLPAALAGRPGAGLFAWRGGSALWTLREAERA
jgi:hypothetical protein